MEDFLPVIGFIIYIALQLSGLLGKKKRSNSPEGGSFPKKPKKSIFEQLEDLEKRLEKSIEPKKQKEVKPVPKVEEYRPLSEQVDRPTYQPISLEITEAPYSNLEEGILDEVHKSKFPHHQEGTSLALEKEPIALFEQVSKKEAFIYSEIFKRKYFQVNESF